jgi:hypothetical protein
VNTHGRLTKVRAAASVPGRLNHDSTRCDPAAVIGMCVEEGSAPPVNSTPPLAHSSIGYGQRWQCRRSRPLDIQLNIEIIPELLRRFIVCACHRLVWDAITRRRGRGSLGVGLLYPAILPSKRGRALSSGLVSQ